MIIHEPILTSSIGGDTIKTNFSGSAYIGYGATSSNATASNEFVIGYNITGSGNNTINIAEKIVIQSDDSINIADKVVIQSDNTVNIADNILVSDNEITNISNIIKADISGSYIGFGSNSSSAAASNEIAIGLGTVGKGDDTVNIADSFVSHPSRSYVGYGSSESAGGVSNELVFGIGITGSGANTVTLGNQDTTETHLFGSLYRTQFITSSITASKFRAYALSGSAYTFHLPADPNPGDSLKISNFQTDLTGSDRFRKISAPERISLGRSGKPIMGLNQDMELDYQAPTFEVIYVDATRGWVIYGSF